MKHYPPIRLFLLLAAVAALAASPVFAHIPPDEDKTGSPCFFVHSNDPETDRLPLKSTQAEVSIAGVIAQVRVTQVYENQGHNPLEAVYIFPASTRAAVHGLAMTIGERTITAVVKKRAEARQDYEQARQNGQSATLLEQQRPNVFQMNVANILPGDVIRVTLDYTELLVPENGIYEFVYPTVVGPRYTGDDAGSADDWAANPYLQEGRLPPYTFDITTDIHAGLPLQQISCPSHQVDIRYAGQKEATVTLDKNENHGGNRDYILCYQLSGGRIETGLQLYEGQSENFFLLMMQPPQTVKKKDIPPRDYLFIFDVSGSMHGFPLDISKELFRNLVKSLRPADRFNVLLFAGGSQVMSPHSVPATQANLTRALNLVDNQRGGGGTRLLPAMQQALAMPGTEGYARSMVVVTDGYVTVEKEAFDLVRNRLGEANLFAFGIGSSVNRHLIEGLARAGQGRPFIITHPDKAAEQAETFRKLIAAPVLTNIEVDYGRFAVYDVEPPAIGDVMGERPVVVFGKYRGRPAGTITVSGDTGSGKLEKTIPVAGVRPAAGNQALRYLWARHRIATLADYNRLAASDERVQEVTTLGLSYNLLTDYTSFIAVDQQTRLENGQPVTVKQPLPLPQGVSNYAVGSSAVRTAKCYQQPAAGPIQTLAGRLAEGLQKTETAAEEVAMDREEKNQPAQKIHLTIKEVRTKTNLAEAAIRQTLTPCLAALQQCIAGIKNRPQELTVRLTVNARGKIVQVSIDRQVKNRKPLQTCLHKALKAVVLPAAGNAFYTVEIILTVKQS